MRSNVTCGLIATCGGTHVLGADLERAQRRVACNHVGDVLVDGLLRLDLAEVAGRVDGADTIQPGRARAKMDRTIGRLELAHGYNVIAIRLERLHDLLELEVPAGLRRVPQLRVDTVRNVHRAKAQLSARARLRERRHHRVQKWQGDGRPECAS
jgi:hypothetical protein